MQGTTLFLLLIASLDANADDPEDEGRGRADSDKCKNIQPVRNPEFEGMCRKEENRNRTVLLSCHTCYCCGDFAQCDDEFNEELDVVFVVDSSFSRLNLAKKFIRSVYLAYKPAEESVPEVWFPEQDFKRYSLAILAYRTDKNILVSGFGQEWNIESRLPQLVPGNSTVDSVRALKYAEEYLDKKGRDDVPNLVFFISDFKTQSESRIAATKPFKKDDNQLYIVTTFPKNYSEKTAFWNNNVEPLTGKRGRVLNCDKLDLMMETLRSYITMDCSKVFYTKSREFERNSMKFYIIAAVFSLFFLLIVLSSGACVYWRKRYRGLRKDRIKALSIEEEARKASDNWEIRRADLKVLPECVLGSGAFGKVTKGMLKREQGGEEIVAVKILLDFAEEPSREEFRREIKLMKSLGRHPHLVSIIACVTTSPPLALVVEYCSDGDMHTFLRINDQQIALKELLSFAWQVSDGLLYISEKGFVHRDVAARNVLVHQDRIAKVGDFGLCRFVYDNATTYMSKGGRLPLKWMALESIRFNEFTTQTDVWSYGVFLYELMTYGLQPYPTVQPFELEDFLRAGNRIRKPEGCPEPLFSLAAKCWAECPVDRPTFAEIRRLTGALLESESGSSQYYTLIL